VSQPEISPLARRLAEENNVEWRGLHGSGAGGKVVERDVLEFLARVMAGEEDVDPTPEPVPEGMEAWPDEDVRTFQQEVQASRKDAGLDEIQRELSASDRRGDSPLESGPMAGPGEQDGAPSEADGISEDIFLFGDDTPSEEIDEGAPGAQDAYGGSTFRRAPAGGDEAEEELLVAGEDDLEVDDVDDGGSFGSGLGDTGTEAGGAAADEALFEGGDRDGGAAAAFEDASEERGDLPDVFGGEETGEDAFQPTGPGAALFADEGDAGDGEDALEIPSLGEVDAGGRGAAGGEEGAYGQPERWREEGAGAAGSFEGDAGWDVDAGPEEPAREAASGAVYGEQAASVPYEATEAAEDAPGYGFEPAGAPEPRPELQDALAAEEPLAGEGAAGAEMPPSPRELPLVSYGALLRRHVDVTALAGAQLAVGLELGVGEPLSPASFLLRAAAKAVREEGWGDGSVAVVAFEDDGSIRSRRIEGAARRPFPELVETLAAGAGDEVPAALSVVDMSALDVDEAVLNVGGPQLTLGRILYDNQRGSYRSTLSLAGEVPAERGARLLARVADLLDAPVRLML